MFHHSFAAPLAAAIFALGTVLPSQDVPGLGLAVAHDPNLGPSDLLVVDVGLQRVSLVNGPSGALSHPFSVADDPYRGDRFYVGTDGRRPQSTVPTEIHATTIRGGQIVSSTVLATDLVQPVVVDLEVVADQLLVLGPRELWAVPLTGSRQPTRLVQFPPAFEGRAMASDGRHVYLAVNNRDILRVDLFDPTRFSPFASIPGAFVNAILDLDISGESIFVGTGDPLLGGEVLEYSLTTGNRLLRLRSGFSAVGALDTDDRTDALFLAGPNAGLDTVRTLRAGTLGTTFGAVAKDLVALAINRAPKVSRFGAPCPDGLGGEPRIRVDRAPRLGLATFRVRLDTRPQRLAALFAADRIAPPQLPQPLALDRFGAPGCTLHFQPTAMSTAGIGPSGSTSVALPIPNAPSLVGLAMDFQWLVLDSAANALGVAASQAAVIVVGN